MVRQTTTTKTQQRKDLQKMFQTGGDVGAALNAASNVKKFITGFLEQLFQQVT